MINVIKINWQVRIRRWFPHLCGLLLIIIACGSDDGVQPDESEQNVQDALQAAVTAVTVTGNDGAYQFNVTIKSPDTGCDQYANWWEVTTPDGKLLYRRILAHSHINEQPFTRNGGPVSIFKPDSVIIRGHMNPQGYGSSAFSGTIQNGFTALEIDTTFAKNLASEAPLPGPCQF